MRSNRVVRNACWGYLRVWESQTTQCESTDTASGGGHSDHHISWCHHLVFQTRICRRQGESGSTNTWCWSQSSPQQSILRSFRARHIEPVEEIVLFQVVIGRGILHNGNLHPCIASKRLHWAWWLLKELLWTRVTLWLSGMSWSVLLRYITLGFQRFRKSRMRTASIYWTRMHGRWIQLIIYVRFEHVINIYSLPFKLPSDARKRKMIKNSEKQKKRKGINK